jgi:hypothetical protein
VAEQRSAAVLNDCIAPRSSMTIMASGTVAKWTQMGLARSVEAGRAQALAEPGYADAERDKGRRPVTRPRTTAHSDG